MKFNVSFSFSFSLHVALQMRRLEWFNSDNRRHSICSLFLSDLNRCNVAFSPSLCRFRFENQRKASVIMGRTVVESSDEKSDNSSEHGGNKKNANSDSDTDLDEEEFVVEKIIDMRTTRRGKVQCRTTFSSWVFLDKLSFLLLRRLPKMERLS